MCVCVCVCLYECGALLVATYPLRPIVLGGFGGGSPEV